MSVGEGSLSGIHAASFCYYKAQPQPITASTRLRFAPPKLAPVGRQLRVLAERYRKDEACRPIHGTGFESKSLEN
jgi:hypothetical protein